MGGARYRSSPVESGQWLLACICYIERLPVLRRLGLSAYHYHRSRYRMKEVYRKYGVLGNRRGTE